MKKFVIARAIFLSIVSMWGTQSAAAALNLFQISIPNSSAFPAPVVYTANVNSDCSFNAKKPIAVNWGGKASFKQKVGLNSVMGIDIAYQDIQKIIFQVKTMVKDKLSWPLTAVLLNQGGQCVAQVLAPDDGQAIQNVSVLALKGYTPTQVAIDGRQVCFNCAVPDTETASNSP